MAGLGDCFSWRKTDICVFLAFYDYSRVKINSLTYGFIYVYYPHNLGPITGQAVVVLIR